MNHQVLARKWRPHNFTEVVGQEHVVKSLTNALQHNRLHHAYLFTGTRGVGKTTLARILAKAINCENLQNFNPCGQCRVCQDVDQGRFLDLIEVDAASRTKVEDTRDLLDNAQYAPNQGRYKVYLIDEVHMLSGHSFNALLKTLEEPPPHVKFLLATTDPHKIPVTVLSRCLQFNLKRLQPTQIFQQMSFILGQENIEFEAPALKTLARSADGSMRDGLSLLDQAIVYGNGKVCEQDVNAMLGTVAQQPVEELLQALANHDAKAIIDKISTLADIQTDFAELLQQLLQQLHRIALLQHIPSLADEELDSEQLQQLVRLLPPEDVQLFYQIGLIGQKDLDLAPDPRSGLEMVLLRMLVFKPASSSEAAIPSKPVTKPKTAGKILQEPIPAEPIAVSQVPVPNPMIDNDWMAMISAMKLESITRQFAQNCQLQAIDDQQCLLTLDAAHQSLMTPMRVEKLQAALRTLRGNSIKLNISTSAALTDTPAQQLAQQQEDRLQNAVKAIHADSNIMTLQEQFDARIIPGSIEPV